MQVAPSSPEDDGLDELALLLEHLNSGAADVLPYQVLEIEEVVRAMPEAVRMAAFATDTPLEFAEKILGFRQTARQAELNIPWYTKGQLEVWDSLVENPYTLVLSGNALGKTFLAAVAALWLYYRGYRVITTAPTARQVEELLWTEIRTLKAQAETENGLTLPGEWAPAAPIVRDPKLPKHTLMGFTAKVGTGEQTATAFQGTHAALMAVIVDEGIAVARAIFEAIDRLVMADPRSRVLVIGNPTDQQSYPYELEEMARTGTIKGVKVIHLSGEDHPNVRLGEIVIPGAITREFVEQQLAKGGSKKSAYYRTSVLGLWPGDVKDALIQMGWIVEAKLRTERRQEADAKILALADALSPAERSAYLRLHFKRDNRGVGLGLDVAGEGDNLTVLTGCEDATLFYPKLSVPCWHVGKDHTEAVNLVITALREIPRVLSISIDDTGLGAAVSAELHRRRDEFPTVSIFIVKGPLATPSAFLTQTVINRVNFGGSPAGFDEENLAKMRDSLYWAVREALRPDSLIKPKLNLPTDVDFRAVGFPPKTDLFAQLANPIMHRDARGLLHILDKRSSDGPLEKTKNLPTLSPDLAHSAALAYWAWRQLPERQAAPETVQEYFDAKVQAIKSSQSEAGQKARATQMARTVSPHLRRAR